jgi:hypothetical protein
VCRKNACLGDPLVGGVRVQRGPHRTAAPLAALVRGIGAGSVFPRLLLFFSPQPVGDGTAQLPDTVPFQRPAAFRHVLGGPGAELVGAGWWLVPPATEGFLGDRAPRLCQGRRQVVQAQAVLAARSSIFATRPRCVSLSAARYSLAGYTTSAASSRGR